MAPLPIKSTGNAVEHLIACCHQIRAIVVLCFCLLFCVSLSIKRLRSRTPSSPNMPHIEKLASVPAMEEKSIGGGLMIFDPRDPISPVDRQLLTELLNPVLVEGGTRRANLMTSGYLAAKAKMEAPGVKTITLSSKTTTSASPASPLDSLSHEDLEALTTSLIVDYQKCQPWSRRSSPGPQQSGHIINPLSIDQSHMSPGIASDYLYHEPEDIDTNTTASTMYLTHLDDHSSRVSKSLHRESIIDETRKFRLFCDDHDSRIKWRRRRTLVFQKTG